MSCSKVLNTITKEYLSSDDFKVLLSKEAAYYLEDMAVKAFNITIRNFGKSICLYTPIYLSNYCINECLYCGFNVTNNIERKRLSLDELEKEAISISKTGLRHILILTGESRKHSSIEYICNCVRILKRYFSSISIEIYPLETHEYELLINEGIDGLTIYQEAYDEIVYDKVHKNGPKKNYRYRFEAPERALNAGIRTVNIGVLLGLNSWEKEVYSLGLHAEYLQKKYPGVEISVSLPRLRPHTGTFNDFQAVTDSEFVQIILALRLFLPKIGITVSTRESEEFRNNLLGLGVTRMSAGSKTSVGGHLPDNTGNDQFEIADERNVCEFIDYLKGKGFQPILKDWHTERVL